MISQKLSRLRTPATASIWYFASSAAIKALGILTTPIFTRLLTEEDFGAYSFYATLLGIGSIISSATSSGSIMYNGIKKYRSDDFLKAAFLTNSVLNLAICSFLFAFSAKHPAFILLILIQLSCDTVIGIYSSKKKYEYDYRLVCILNGAVAVLSVLFSLILITGAEAGYNGRIYGMLIASIIVAAIPLKRILSTDGGQEFREGSRYLTDNTIAYLPHAVFGAASAQADKLLVGYFLGSVALGKYSVAHSLGVGLTFAVTAIGSALSPWTVRKISAGRLDTVRELNRILFILTACGTVVLCAVAPELMRFLAPHEYSIAIPAVFPAALATLPHFATSICSNAIIFGGKTRLLSKATLICALINVAMGIILIPTLSYLGAGLVLLISNTALLIFEFRFLKTARLDAIFPKESFIYYFSFSGAAVLLSAILYNYAWARLLIIIPALAIGVAAVLASKKYILEKAKI